MWFTGLIWKNILSFMLNPVNKNLNFTKFKKMKNLKRKLDINMNFEIKTPSTIYWTTFNRDRPYELSLRILKYDFVKANSFHNKRTKIKNSLSSCR